MDFVSKDECAQWTCAVARAASHDARSATLCQSRGPAKEIFSLITSNINCNILSIYMLTAKPDFRTN